MINILYNFFSQNVGHVSQHSDLENGDKVVSLLLNLYVTINWSNLFLTQELDDIGSGAASFANASLA